jgi:hypothetical protein
MPEYEFKDGKTRIVPDQPIDPLHYLKRKADHLMAELNALKEAIADVAVGEEALVAYVKQLEEELAKAKEGSTGSEAEQTEINELASSATTSADALKAAVPAA